ncbi:hypothetical protein NUH30_18700 [Leptospira sp. 85282-16]|uniref:hypothetical protein n=1 Tax=Leptospira sp. 85282-16 TaxID=2971256 RepID=UPI0021BEC86B|nr:hypothetical protein [Leptospira sp. 85282-16]MCT8335722.1 hypothetical protein [Leptospira sp. 85282-16]
MSIQLELFAPAPYRLVIARCGTPVAVGNEVPLSRVMVFGLSPGDRINQIGEAAKSGKVTSASRVDQFEPAVIYEGILDAISFNEDDIGRYLAFRDQTMEEPTFLLYMFESESLGLIDDELFVYNFKTKSPRFYRRFFGKLNFGKNQ